MPFVTLVDNNSWYRKAMRKDNDMELGLHLVVVIPCLNEDQTVGRVASGVPRDIEGIRSVEILVMDDGSTDETAARARKAGAEVFSHPTNQGLGATFKDAIRIVLAKGADVMVHIDGDGQFDPADIPLLVKPVVTNRAHMVTASRFLDRDMIPEMTAVKRWGNRGVARIVWLLTGGGPGHATDVFATYTYKLGFVTSRLGYGETVSVILAPVLIVIIMILSPLMLRGESE